MPRENILRSLNLEFKALSTSSPGVGLLFGGDLQETLIKLEANKLTTRLSAKSRPNTTTSTNSYPNQVGTTTVVE